ncbi:DNA-invertase hin [Maioricimonas rarisocia]|uniref:DNA-invertase hin n=1 Tax=Maioricimonas rarisocia TaxID=2528026 RepID=A0A517ZB97_9PLAN|nr:recombinase family protein [Maioricimonas rarisocia]QDU39709.1 DNA-invertase hin [Maioricimonas rarisocia]
MTRTSNQKRRGRSSERDRRTVRCAIYTRKSTEEGLEQEFNSLDAQRESGEAYIASQKGEGWVCLPDRYDDGGFTGGNMERPALQRLIADIEAGQIDCVVVYKVDRLSRSLFDFADLVKVFEQHGVTFVAVTQHFNTTDAMGRLTLNILLSFAQFEREIIGERIRDKIAAQRRKGKWAGGYPVLGYDIDRSGNSPKLVVNAQEAARVRKIFSLYLKLGSLLPTVEALEVRGWANKSWRTKRGNVRSGRPFDRGTLYALLTNPIYIGRIRHKTHVFDGEHEPIVPEKLFRKVQETLQQNGRNGGAGVRNKYHALLKGLLVCAACERTMSHTFTSRGQKRYRYYTCTRAIHNGRRACPSRSLPAAEIEQAVVDEIRGIAADTDLRAEILTEARRHIDEELTALQTEERQLKRDIARWYGDLRPRPDDQHNGSTERTAELLERIRRAELRMVEIGVRKGDLESEGIDQADVDAAFADFEGLWEALTPRERVRLLALLVERVTFNAEQSTIAVTFHATGINALMAGGAA